MADPILDKYAVLVAAAREEAAAGLAEGGIPIGSVIADENGTIVARGRNRRVQDGDPTAHAEVSCVRAAGRRRDWHQLTMVTTLSPCAMCSGTAVLYNFKRVVIGERTSFSGREDWLRDAGIEVICLDDAGCRELMQQCLEKMPEVWAEDIAT